MSRLIRVSDDLLDFIGTRTDRGERLSYEWGEPDAQGVYEPTIRYTDDGVHTCRCRRPSNHRRTASGEPVLT